MILGGKQCVYRGVGYKYEWLEVIVSWGVELGLQRKWGLYLKEMV